MWKITCKGSSTQKNYFDTPLENSRDTELMQYLLPPLSLGPSSKTCPRCPTHFLHMTSMRRMPRVESSLVAMLPLLASKNAGQPHPESNLVSEVNRTTPHAAHLYLPLSKNWSYLPVKGISVPFSRRTWYCSGVSFF